jgi:hypothetical protein
MTQADSVLSTPPTNTPISQADATSRRRFLSNAAGIAAGGAVLAMATIPPASATAAPTGALDPVFSLIEAHRTASVAHAVACDEQAHLEDGDTEDACVAAVSAFDDLIQTAPTTCGGLVAWASYLHEIRKVEEWLLEGEAPRLVETLVEALQNLKVAS